MKHRGLIFLVITIFLMGLTTLGFAGEEITGQVTKVEGKAIFVKQADGSTVKAELGDGMDLKKGDTVTVKDGKVIKKDAFAKKPKKRVIEGC